MHNYNMTFFYLLYDKNILKNKIKSKQYNQYYPKKVHQYINCISYYFLQNKSYTNNGKLGK